MKYREKWCPSCSRYLPQRGASSHKCLYKGTVLVNESKIKCFWYDKKLENKESNNAKN
jgi:hypothetical protein